MQVEFVMVGAAFTSMDGGDVAIRFKKSWIKSNQDCLFIIGYLSSIAGSCCYGFSCSVEEFMEAIKPAKNDQWLYAGVFHFGDWGEDSFDPDMGVEVVVADEHGNVFLRD